MVHNEGVEDIDTETLVHNVKNGKYPNWYILTEIAIDENVKLVMDYYSFNGSYLYCSKCDTNDSCEHIEHAVITQRHLKELSVYLGANNQLDLILYLLEKLDQEVEIYRSRLEEISKLGDEQTTNEVSFSSGN